MPSTRVSSFRVAPEAPSTPDASPAVEERGRIARLPKNLLLRGALVRGLVLDDHWVRWAPRSRSDGRFFLGRSGRPADAGQQLEKNRKGHIPQIQKQYSIRIRCFGDLEGKSRGDQLKKPGSGRAGLNVLMKSVVKRRLQHTARRRSSRPYGVTRGRGAKSGEGRMRCA